ncbi:MAG: ABC transporter permease [Magnetococcales bacterium]|nr:ABC transporter permease [Magnetococcales bacterium]
MSGFFSSLQPINTIASLTIQEGVKTRLIPLVLGLLFVGVLLSSFAGTLAVTESREIQSALLGSFLRLAGVLVLCLFVLNSQVREYHDKGLELILALPVPRSHYFFGKLAGHASLAFLMVLSFAATLLFYAPADQVFIWSVSLFFELLIVVALSLFCLFTFNQVPAAFTVVFAIYLLSRVMTSLILVGQGPIMPQQVVVNWVMNQMMWALSFLLPGLDRFTQSRWLAYGGAAADDLLFVVGQGTIYLLFLGGAALIDLYRKSV